MEKVFAVYFYRMDAIDKIPDAVTYLYTSKEEALKHVEKINYDNSRDAYSSWRASVKEMPVKTQFDPAEYGSQ